MAREYLLMLLFFIARVSALHTQKEWGDLDGNDNLDEDEFEERFNVGPASDPREEARRRQALKKNEYFIKKENEDFIEGKQPYWSELDDFDNLPDDEFLEEKTGESLPNYGRGFLHVYGPESVDEESERYFDKFRYSRATIPDSYSSVDEGNVTPVRNQGYCGSCVAFSNMAAIETCYKKITGVFGDYSEQQLIDCGYGKNGARACHGASPWAYAKYVADNNLSLAHESVYPYLKTAPKYTCPKDLKPYNQGASVTKAWFTKKGNEETLKRLVYEHGAVTTGVQSRGGFQRYGGGIFQGCRGTREDHAITVVGYGSEGGKNFWLIKNSWGKSWGEQGYIRLLRGYGMCGIGKTVVAVSCGDVPGPTDAPLTTSAPCLNKYSERYCQIAAKTNCQKYGEKCARACGLCKHMKPHITNTCPDLWANCKKIAKTSCGNKRYGKECCLSCGLGEGMTPVPSNKCYDFSRNCANPPEAKHKGKMCILFADKCKKFCGLC